MASRLLSLFVAVLLAEVTTADPVCVQSSGAEGLSATCVGGSQVPATLPKSLRMLKLENTTLTVLTDDIFAHLPNLVVIDVSGNGLTRLTRDAFVNITHLKTLNLASNKLCFADTAIPVDVFRNAISLRTLLLHSNDCPGGHVGYPDRALGMLTALETLTMNGIRDVPLGLDFAKLKSLKSLELSGKHCNLGNLTDETFAVFANGSLSQLSLRACNIEKLDYNTFIHLQHLRSLNLACNERVGMVDATYAIKESGGTSLDTVILDDVSNSTVILDAHHFSGGFSFKTVRRLSLSANDVVGVGVRMMHHLPAVRTITAGYNSRYSFFPSKNWLEIMHNETEDIHVEVIDASHMPATRSEYRRLFCTQDLVHFDDYFREKPRLPHVTYSRPTRPASYKPSKTAFIPPSLQVVFLDHSAYQITTDVADYTEMVVVNMSYTDTDVLKGPLTGFGNLQVLDARHCRIYQIYSGALRGLGLLKYLYLQHNVIGEGVSDQFVGLHSLLELDLSYNKIPSIGSAAFRDMVHIRKLNLRGNRLTVLGFSLGSTAAVVSIDVADNRLAYADSSFIKGAGATTEIDMTGNAFVCNCSSAAFVRWLRTTNVTLTDKKHLKCVNETGCTVDIVAIDDSHVPSSCHVSKVIRGHFFGIILGCLFIAVVLVFAVIVGLRRYSSRRSGSKVAYRLFDGNVSM